MKKIKDMFKKLFSTKHGKLVFASFLTSLLLLIGVTTAWFVSSVTIPNSNIETGTLSFVAKGYNMNGDYIKDLDSNNPDAASQTLYTIKDWKATSTTTFYISIEKSGTLDMDFSLSFTVDGKKEHLMNIGAYWYRVTMLDSKNLSFPNDQSDVNHNPKTANYSEVIKAYKQSEFYDEIVLCDPSICTVNHDGTRVNHHCTEYSDRSQNMINANRLSNYGKLTDLDRINNSHRMIIRVDVGMCKLARPERYTGNIISLGGKIFATQLGKLENPTVEGKKIKVTNAAQLRDAVDIALPGDTILLAAKIDYVGDLIFNKCVNLETSGNDLNITGNLIYDFDSSLTLTLDLSGGGNINIFRTKVGGSTDSENYSGGNLEFKTPNSQVEIKGFEFLNHISTEEKVYVYATKALDTFGFKLSNIKFLNKINKNIEGDPLPKDIHVTNDSRILIDTDVEINDVIIENTCHSYHLINLGKMKTVRTANMQLVDEDPNAPFDGLSPKIDIINYGVLGKIVLPNWATPFKNYKPQEEHPLNPNYECEGNTRIVREWNASEIVIESSTGGELPHFKPSDIEDKNSKGIFVEALDPNDEHLIVYYDDMNNNPDTKIEDLLRDYFKKKNIIGQQFTLRLNAIKILEIKSMQNKLVTPTDILFIKNNMFKLESLNMADAKLLNDKLPDNAFVDKKSLHEVILPSSLKIIGDNALSGNSLLKIEIPSTVNYVGTDGLYGIRYIFIKGDKPFDFATSGTFSNSNLFVAENVLEIYKKAWTSNPDKNLKNHIYVEGIITDDTDSVVRRKTTGQQNGYELVVYTGTDKEIQIGANLFINGNPVTIVSVGIHAFTNLKNPFDVSFTRSVTVISAGAFSNSKVRNIDFTNVEEIRQGAFFNCKYITSLDLKNVKTVGGGAFAKCSNLFYLHLNQVETISDAVISNGVGFGAFEDCGNITVLECNKIKYIGTRCFIGVGNILVMNVYNKSINTDLTVKTPMGLDKNSKIYTSSANIDTINSIFGAQMPIPPYRLCEFGHVYGENWVVKKALIDGTSTEIGRYNLGEYILRLDSKSINKTCSIITCPQEVITNGPKNNFEIPNEFNVNGVTYKNIGIEKYAFYTVKLDHVDMVFGNNILSINHKAFSNEKALPSAKAPLFEKNIETINFGSVTTIGAYAFEHVFDLDTIDNNLIEVIGEGAFEGCKDLLTVELPAIVEFTKLEGSKDTNTFKDCKSLVILNLGVDFIKIEGPNFINGCINLHQLILEADYQEKAYTFVGFYEGLNNIPNLKIYLQPKAIEGFVKKMYEEYPNFVKNFYELGENIGKYEVMVEWRGQKKGVNIGEYTVNYNHIDIHTGVPLTDGLSINSYNVNDKDVPTDYLLPNTIKKNSDGTITINDPTGVPVRRVGTNSFVEFPFDKINLSDPANENFKIPDNLNVVGPYAFSATNIRISNFNKIKKIGDKAFDRCNNIYLIDAPELEHIRFFTFNKMENVRRIIAPKLMVVGLFAMTNLPNCQLIQTNVVECLAPVSPQANWYDNDYHLRCMIFGVNKDRAINFSIINDKVLTITNAINIRPEHKDFVYDAANIINTGKIKLEIEDAKRPKTIIYHSTLPEYLVNRTGPLEIYRYFAKTTGPNYEIPNSLTIEDYLANPATTETKTVVGIHQKAYLGVNFAGRPLIIPSGLVKIGPNAFKNCNIGGTLILGDSLTTIDDYAFAGNNITSVEASSLHTLGKGVFKDCTSLNKVTIDNQSPNENLQFTHIPDETFSGCVSLTDIVLYNPVTVGINNFAPGQVLKIFFLKKYDKKEPIPELVGWDNYSGFIFYVNIENIKEYKNDPHIKGRGKQPIHTVLEYGIIIRTNDYDIALRLIDQNLTTWDKPYVEIISFILKNKKMTELSIPSQFDIEVLDDQNNLQKVSATLRSIAPQSFLSAPKLTKITLPSTYKYFYENVFDPLADLQKITVDYRNTTFKSESGILYEKLESGWFGGAKSLCYFPRSYRANGAYVTDFTIKYDRFLFIRTSAFRNARYLTSVTLSTSYDLSEIAKSYVVFGSKVFWGTPLTQIKFTYPTPPFVLSDDVFDPNNSQLKILVPVDAKDVYLTNTLFSKHKDKIVAY